MSNAKVRGEVHLVDPGDVEALREYFAFLRSEFECYRALSGSGLSQTESTLDGYPVMDPDFAQLLASEVARKHAHDCPLLDMTSGTTGERKVRISTARDEAAEATVSRLFFAQCGFDPDERVVALDVDSSDIYLFYGDVLRELGVARFTFLAANPDSEEVVTDLASHEPSTLLTTPTLLQRIMPALAPSHVMRRLRRVVYLGEPMPQGQRGELNKHGIEVFSFLGSTETGTLGGECRAHNGIHLFHRHIIPSIAEPAITRHTLTGDVSWTTMHFRDHPLVKYPTGDHVSVNTNRCACGIRGPRVTGIRRGIDQFSIFGQSFYHDAFVAAIHRQIGASPSLQIQISGRDGQCHVRFRFSPHLKRESLSLELAVRSTADFGELVDAGFITCELEFDATYSNLQRKLRRVVDRRSDL